MCLRRGLSECVYINSRKSCGLVSENHISISKTEVSPYLGLEQPSFDTCRALKEKKKTVVQITRGMEKKDFFRRVMKDLNRTGSLNMRMH